MGIQIISAGSALPGLAVTNDDLSKFLDTSDEWISTRTGIKQRYIATNETTTDLGAKAARVALENSGISKADIELVVCATGTPDVCAPTVAANIKKELGIESAPAFDMNTNCSSFIYAITVAESLMKNCNYKNAIVIGVDVNSQIVDWQDRGTAVLFGDGAGAVVLSNTENTGIISTHLDCIIDKDNSLACNNKIEATPFSEADYNRNAKVTMNGKSIMRFATKAFTEAVNEVVDKADISVSDIKLIIPHQANLRILKAAAGKMNIDEDKIYVNIDKVANTQAGTIPIALHEALEKKLINRGDIILFVAFGAGLSSGAVLLKW
ncbi:3-oxoacyl-(acyl-carrier-protein) synthase 3 [Clostridium sp. DL-VIII]|uniref:beta-ketoacyl-ACP synthase III n=1 Tax=Clostridium sp. DL-VIII TaxID=641107 RepID=UPI00023B06EC|nr:beta-ketoacyl-ACP synthase III [Clostridium sp. DL-VIII]EHJ00999.1 3-oxoacyl-(acyl-carrier-protein) synthase 3 [Clostridium sp. DL-VIII]